MARECHCMTQPSCETYSVAKSGVFIFSANTEYTVLPSLIESGDCDLEGAIISLISVCRAKRAACAFSNQLNILKDSNCSSYFIPFIYLFVYSFKTLL